LEISNWQSITDVDFVFNEETGQMEEKNQTINIDDTMWFCNASQGYFKSDETGKEGSNIKGGKRVKWFAKQAEACYIKVTIPDPTTTNEGTDDPEDKHGLLNTQCVGYKCGIQWTAQGAWTGTGKYYEDSIETYRTEMHFGDQADSLKIECTGGTPAKTDAKEVAKGIAFTIEGIVYPETVVPRGKTSATVELEARMIARGWVKDTDIWDSVSWEKGNGGTFTIAAGGLAELAKIVFGVSNAWVLGTLIVAGAIEYSFGNGPDQEAIAYAYWQYHGQIGEPRTPPQSSEGPPGDGAVSSSSEPDSIAKRGWTTSFDFGKQIKSASVKLGKGKELGGLFLVHGVAQIWNDSSGITTGAQIKDLGFMWSSIKIGKSIEYEP
jgi:hypothetical protein